MKKHEYTLFINKEIKNGEHVFCYSYGNTKNIGLMINKDSATLRFTIGTNKSLETIAEWPLVKDAIKKIIFAQYVMYRTKPKTDSFKYSMDNGEKREATIPQIISLLDSENIPDLSKLKEKDKIISRIINKPFNNESNQNSCIFSFVIAQTKKHYQEKFNYLWTSFNSFYKEIARKNDTTEKEKLVHLLKTYGLGKETCNKKDKKRIAISIGHAIRKWYDKPIYSERSINSELLNDIKTILSNEKLDTTPYGYLLVDYAYYLRCSFFHGEKPSKIICYEHEADLNNLNIAIVTIEQFLFENMKDIFKEDINDDVK